MLKDTPFRCGAEVITETGIKLGWVKERELKSKVGNTLSLLLSSVQPSSPFFWVGSTYEISVNLVTHSSKSGILVREGAEEQISCLQMGLLERFGFRGLPWQKQNEGWYVRPIVSVSNGNDNDEGHLNHVPKPTPPTPNGDRVASCSLEES